MDIDLPDFFGVRVIDEAGTLKLIDAATNWEKTYGDEESRVQVFKNDNLGLILTISTYRLDDGDRWMLWMTGEVWPKAMTASGEIVWKDSQYVPYYDFLNITVADLMGKIDRPKESWHREN